MFFFFFFFVPGTKIALIILNRPLDIALTTKLWTKSKFVEDCDVHKLITNSMQVFSKCRNALSIGLPDARYRLVAQLAVLGANLDQGLGVIEN